MRASRPNSAHRLFALAATASFFCGCALPAAELTPGELSFFENNIRPLLAKNCYPCHSREAERVRAGLYLDTRQGVLKGGDSGPAVVPGDTEASLLIRAVRYTDPDLQMPPKGKKLRASEIAALENWVRMGVPDPRDETPSTAQADPKHHWAFQPLRKISVPRVTNQEWVMTPVDAFVLEKLEASGMRPSAKADRRTLIRRITFDLIGLPPSLEQTEAFVADPSPKAYETVVERLLCSPSYGERWGRHWLDVARYADTKGEINPRRDSLVYPFAWTYRDYVIKAFNEDLPFNQFIVEQLAADRIGTQDKSRLAALGFLTVGNRFNNNRNDIINDRIDVVTKGFLGLTVTCARCHDHKFDPIPTEDYYSLHGIFASSVEPEIEPILSSPQGTGDYLDYEKRRTELAAQEKQLEGEFMELRRSRTRDPATQRKRQQLQREMVRTRGQIVDLEMTHPGAVPRAMAMQDSPRARDSRVFLRGEAENKGPVAPRRFLQVLSGPNRPLFRNGSGRLELALAIASPNNPLTARVLVNRIWLHHFGQGLVRTPDDLGVMSEPPSHQALLDYLAIRFVETGWSIKQLHRLIVLSNTYQQQAENNANYAQNDPENRLLWRANVKRLEVEALRDSLLAMGGELDLTPGGRPFELDNAPLVPRRTIYALMSRNEMPELFAHFDMANPDMPSGVRHQTAVPQQALFLMNSPMVVEQAKHLVARDGFYDQGTDAARVRYLYNTIYQRPPGKAELELGLAFVAAPPSREAVAASAPQRSPADGRRRRAVARARRPRAQSPVRVVRQPLTAWQEYAHALLMSNEAWFVP